MHSPLHEGPSSFQGPTLSSGMGRRIPVSSSRLLTNGSTLQRLEQSNLPLARQLKTSDPPQEVVDHRTSGNCLQRLFEGVAKSLANTTVEVSPPNDLAKLTQSSPRGKVPIRR
jgi:hypothetical protein